MRVVNEKGVLYLQTREVIAPALLQGSTILQELSNITGNTADLPFSQSEFHSWARVARTLGGEDVPKPRDVPAWESSIVNLKVRAMSQNHVLYDGGGQSACKQVSADTSIEQALLCNNVHSEPTCYFGGDMRLYALVCENVCKGCSS